MIRIDYYGPGIAMDALGNTIIGSASSAKKWFVRFRAKYTGNIETYKFPFLSADYPGYGAGTGGTWKLSVHPDDNTPSHFPNENIILASVNVSASSVSNNAKTINFGSVGVTKGKLYHIVMENTDGFPNANYFSANHAFRFTTDPGSFQLNPRFTDIEWATGYYFGGKWSYFPRHCPIADIGYTEGYHQGMSYGEASYWIPGDSNNDIRIGEVRLGNKTRENFTVSGGNQRVINLGIRVTRENHTDKPLVVKIYRQKGNALLKSISINQSEAHIESPPMLSPNSTLSSSINARWIVVPIYMILQDGESYYLEFSSESLRPYYMWPIRNLVDEYGYDPATGFSEGYAETQRNGQWVPMGRVPYQFNLPFYFTTVVNETNT